MEFAWPTGLDPTRSFLSELDAAHRPHREFYAASDLITAICAILASLILLLPRPAVSGAATRTAATAFGIFGVGTIADVLAPIECIPGIDRHCHTSPPGILPQLHHLHAFTSSVAFFAIFATMIAAGIAAYRHRIWAPVRTVGAVLFVVVAVSTVWMLAADGFSGDYRLGLAQRIQIGGMTLWLVVWGYALAAPPRGAESSTRVRT